MSEPTRNLIVVSDTHCGCQFGLCSPDGLTLDGGGHYEPSHLQTKVWTWWREFWDEWVPKVTRGEPYAVELNGDTTDGRHHDSTTQISQNLADQKHLAEEILFPVIERASALYMVRGTESHVGAAGENEEMLGESLGAVPSETGQYTRLELSLRIGGDGGPLCHFTHHIGTTGRTHYESSAPMGEMGEVYAEAGTWNHEIPDFIIRSHRHRHIKIQKVTHKGYGIVEVTPGWQLKTPFVFKINARNSTPQFGGICIRKGDEDHYSRAFVKTITRPDAEVI